MVKQAASAWVADYAPSMGAGLSYYSVFSLAPLLLIVISLAGLVFGQDAVRGELFGQLSGLLGADAAQAIEGLLASVSKPVEGIASTLIGVVLLLIGATTFSASCRTHWIELASTGSRSRGRAVGPAARPFAVVR